MGRFVCFSTKRVDQGQREIVSQPAQDLAVAAVEALSPCSFGPRGFGCEG